MSLTPPPLPAQITAPPVVKMARTGLVLALATIVVCVGYVLGGNDLRTAAEPLLAVRPSAISNMMARYAIGVQLTMKAAQMWQAKTADDLALSLSKESRKPVDEFRAEILSAVLHERESRPKIMDSVVKRDPQLRDDLSTLRELEDNGADLDKAQWKTFEQRHGWIARLARAQATSWEESDADKLRHEAQLTSAALGMMAMGGLGALVLGIVLLIKTLLRWRDRGVPTLVQRVDKQLAPVLVEAFALYLAAYTLVLSTLHQWFPATSNVAFYGVALVFVIAAIFWPRWRGMEPLVWKQAMGFHTGEGWRKEMQAGVLGWITGLPMLMVAALLAPLIARWTGADPTHPMVENFEDHGMGRYGMVALAVIWAPLVEETMFRGLLFPGLASLSRWIVGALVSAFVFAVIHPQGWAGVPAIMAIALTMSALRLTRGSLIAPMTAHALNNGLVSLLLIFAL